MIDTKYWATYFTTLLNNYGSNLGKCFKIFADEGELKKAIVPTKNNISQNKIDYTSGIVEIISSTLLPIRDIRLNTYNLQLKLFVDLELNGFNKDKESYNLIDIRDLLSNMIELENGKTTIETIGNTSYSQSITFNYPTNGTKTELGFINDCLPIYLTVNVAMFENGINANNCKLEVNGIDLPFTRLVLTRQKTAEQNTFSGNKSGKTIIQLNGLSVDLVMPALSNNDFSALIMKDILNGTNQALSVKISTPLETKMFIGVLGNTQASLDIATNVGYNLSIVEGKENVLDYDNNWTNYYITETSTSITLVKKGIIYWGDDTAEEKEAGTYMHTYNDGKNVHYLRVYGG